MDIPRHIEYWKNGSEEDLDTASLLVREGKLRQGMFFAHLALEKALKAHLTKKSEAVPPRIHNLERLAALAEMSPPEPWRDLLARMNVWALEGRYPLDANGTSVTPEQAADRLSETKGLVEWLLNTL